MKYYTPFSGIATVMSFSHTNFSLFLIIFTFQSPLPASLAIITQYSERSLWCSTVCAYICIVVNLFSAIFTIHLSSSYTNCVNDIPFFSPSITNFFQSVYSFCSIGTIFFLPTTNKTADTTTSTAARTCDTATPLKNCS